MALGFGFNKVKVLASAEKFVQQGKLPNAVGEYLKVIKYDPKDLTVMNTVGDLYARMGKTAEAIQYFKQVGDAYAGDGFIVKAIAIYKKLTKLNPSATDCVIKLAELYVQQGLQNDARAQYLSIAERFLRSGDNQLASDIFRKLLDLDPENAAIQAKLAELCLKSGNQEEARNIFFNAAESLFRRGAMEAADEALASVLSLDPNHTAALMLRGQIATEDGNAEKALEYLKKVPNLDSQLEALRALFRVHLQMGNLSEALPIASKLLNVHNDRSGIISCGERLMASGQHEEALRLYDQYADRLLADDHDGIVAKLSSVPAHLSDNPAALELVLKLYRKAGDTTHRTEVMELLAHALVQAGELTRARDLYNELVVLEPGNPLHAQNYKQVSAKLGDDAATRPLTPDEGAQALMVDELEIAAPALEQEYPEEVARAIRTALTDSELLDSYNLPSKAIAPLEALLPSAPRDALLNQRLASLYARAERYSEAARCCDILCTAYREAGHDQFADQYAEISAKYHERAGEALPDYTDLPAPAVSKPEAHASAELLWPPAEDSEQVPAQASQTAAVPAGHSGEIDASREWEEMIAVEPPDHRAGQRGADEATCAGDVVGDLLEEVRFYISQGMWEEAQAGIEKCAALAPGIPELDELRKQVENSRAVAAAAPEVEVVEEESAPESRVATLVFDAAALGVAEKPLPPDLSEPAPVLKVPDTSKTDDVLAGMVQELEETLGEDFAIAPPAPLPTTAPGGSALPSVVAPPSTPRPEVVTTPRAFPPEPVPLTMVPAAAAAVVSSRVPQAPSRPRETGSALADVFEEFKEDMEGDGAGVEEQDPETHYNMGVAFREMGLLEEAIGELQKVCHAIDHGHAFPHVLQVYTWLAECLVNKGTPQAAIKWYQRALQVPGVDEETRMAVSYEMAAAYEAGGNRQAALDNFMEVYANNIDYRDVAERIKALKA